MNIEELLNPDREALLEKWSVMLKIATPISQWTTGSELAWLCELASQCMVICEVGSYKGKSAKAMAYGCRGTVVCVDDFKGLQCDTRADFEQNLASELHQGRVVLFPFESEESAQYIKQSETVLDAVFIDAGHLKEDVLRDLQIWTPLVKVGGLVCGHDCFPDDPDNGVTQALKEFRPDYKLVIDSIFAFQK